MYRLTPRLLCLLAYASVAWLMNGPSPLLANMGPPSVFRSGSQLGEIQGASTVDIVREELHVDLRPLAKAQPVPITVHYLLDNQGAVQTLDLLFVGGPMASGPATIRLNGQPVATVVETLKELPESWVVPRFTDFSTGFGSHGRPGPGHSIRGLRFQLALTPGRHEVDVEYLALAFSEARADEERILWSVPYVLAPARAWREFGELQITVQLPPDWHLVSNLNLSGNEDERREVFTGIPADALVLQAQAPDRYPAAAAVARNWGVWMMLILGSVATGAASVLLGRWLGRRGLSAAWTLALAVAVGATWLVGTPLAAGLLQWARLALSADTNQASWYFGKNSAYGIFFATLALAVVAPLGSLLVSLLAYAANRVWPSSAAPLGGKPLAG